MYGPVRITTANQKSSKAIAHTSILFNISITNLPLLLNVPISLNQHYSILCSYAIAGFSLKLLEIKSTDIVLVTLSTYH